MKADKRFIIRSKYTNRKNIQQRMIIDQSFFDLGYEIKLYKQFSIDEKRYYLIQMKQEMLSSWSNFIFGIYIYEPYATKQFYVKIPIERKLQKIMKRIDEKDVQILRKKEKYTKSL